MFSLPGVLALIVLIYLQPQGVFPALESVPLLYISFFLAVLGIVVDLRLRLAQLSISPQLYWIVAFLAWSLVTIAIANPRQFVVSTQQAGILLALYFSVAHGLHTFWNLKFASWLIIAIALFLTVIGIHQNFAEYGCLEIDPDAVTIETGIPDGRRCKSAEECEKNALEPGARYICERVGLLGTTSIGHGRVRYRGILQDPNELALAISIALPLVVSVLGARRSFGRISFLGIVWALTSLCVWYTGSRGGVLTLVSILGTYVLRRFGWRGIFGALLIAIPFFLVVSSVRSDASGSSSERLACWFEGMQMFKSAPFIGVGYGQFLEYHFLTAHNSYILVAAELGGIGSFLWTGLLYVTVKIPWQIWRSFREHPESDLVRRWSFSLLSSMIGLLIGAFFLSFSYHYVLWTHVALCGSLYRVIRTRDAEFRLRFGLWDVLAIGVITIALVVGLYGFTRLNPPDYW